MNRHFVLNRVARWAVPTFVLCLLLTATAPAQGAGRPVDISGEASVVIIDDLQAGRSELRYYLVNPHSRRETRLFFPGKAPVEFKTGRQFRVRGRGRPDGVDVANVTPVGSAAPEPTTEGSTSSAPLASPETRNVLTLLVDFNDASVDGVGMNYGVSLQEATDRMYNETKSVAGLFHNASLGTLTIPPDPDNDGLEDVFGPYLINDSYIGGDSSQCSPSTWVNLASSAWQAANPGKDINLYRHRLLIVPNYWDWGNRHCGWGGVAQVGCGSWCWAVAADPDSILHGVIIHELGHNLGLHHARTDSGNDGYNSQIDSEYGDTSDMMGSSRNWMKFNPPHIEDKSWVDPVDYEVRTVVPSASVQAFELIAMDEEAWDWQGLRALKIPRTSNTDYYISWRLQAGDYNNVTSSYANRVSIHYGFDSSTYSYHVTRLAPGESFVDPYNNVTITATSATTLTAPDGITTTAAMGIEVCENACSSIAAPSNLTATAQSIGAIDLAWVDNSDNEDGFRLERSTDGTSWSLIATSGGTFFMDTGLDTATTYQYRVHAYNTGDTSGYSNVAMDTTFAVPPTADFTWSATYLEAGFMDASSDSDGTVTGWSWDFGDGSGSNAANPTHAYAAAGDYTVQLTVTDNHGATDTTSQQVNVENPPFVDFFASSETLLGGVLQGNYTATFVDDGVPESITERESGGKPSKRHTLLEHRWSTAISSGGTATLSVNAWQSVSTDGDTFDFEFSSDGILWAPMFNVSATGDPAGVQSYVLPPGTSGTVHVRVVDTDRSPGHRSKDKVFIDFLKIQVASAVGDPPDGDPSGLTAMAVSYDQVDLFWVDGATNEVGSIIERRENGGAWSEIGTTAANVTAFDDTGLSGSTFYEYRVRGYNGVGSSAWSNIAGATTDPAPAILLSSSGYKVKGKHQVDLSWSGGSGNMDVYRNGVKVATAVAGPYTDFTGNKGSATYDYQVCETGGTSACSNTVTVVF